MNNTVDILNWNKFDFKGNYSICPSCSANRTKKKVKCVKRYEDKRAYCHHCDTSFIISENGSLIEPSKVKIQRPKAYYHSQETYDKFAFNLNTSPLVQFLYEHFDKNAVDRTLKDYKVGASLKWGGAIVFWQLDQHENIRYGKVVRHDKETGKSIKEPWRRILNISSILNINTLDKKEYQCPFGLHLLNQYPDRTLAFVEGEKTALIMSIVSPQYLWIATGGSNMLKEYTFRSIKNRNVKLFPDKGKYNEWKAIADKVPMDVQVDTTLRDMNVPNNYDLADLVLEEIFAKKKPTATPPTKPPKKPQPKTPIPLNKELYNQANQYAFLHVFEENWLEEVQYLEYFFAENEIPTTPMFIDHNQPANVPKAVIDNIFHKCRQHKYMDQTIDFFTAAYYMKLYIESKTKIL